MHWSLYPGQIYRAGDAPRYIPGHIVNASFMLMTAVVAGLMHLNLKRINAKRDDAAAADLKVFSGNENELGDASVVRPISFN